MQEDYSIFLKSELDHRKSRNAAYSQKAFARDLGISASALSELLNGKHGLSRDKAERVADRLGYDRDETEYFCDLMD